MPSDTMLKAMEAMGWNTSSTIPMANEENLQLLKELDFLFDERVEMKETLQQVEERLDKLYQHTKNAEISINHNLKLLHAHKSEVEEEHHLHKVVDREYSKLKEGIKKNNAEMDNFKKYTETTQKELCKRQRNVDDMTNRMQWAKTALLEWNEAMEDGRKGYLMIEKYFKEDEVKARQQDKRRQVLQDEIDKVRKEMIVLYDEQKSLEQCLECTANLYRSAHHERRVMVQTWKTAVNHMTQRERDIAQKEMQLVELQHEAKKKSDENKNYDNKLNEIIDNNRKVEAAIEDLNNDTSEIKSQIQVLSDLVILKENEVDIVQKELQNLSNRVQQQRTENRQNEKQKNEKLNELRNFEQLIVQLNERLAKMQNQTMTAQQRLQMLEELNDAEQKTQQLLNRETSDVNTLIFRTQQQLKNLQDESIVIKVANDGIRATKLAMENSIRESEKELLRQTELHYSLSFKLLQVERRVIKLEGGSLDPEVEQRHLQHLQHLEDASVKMNKRLQATESQNKKLDDDMRKLTNAFNADSKRLEVINFHIKQAQVYCDGGVKRYKVENNQNQVLIVELSLLKMRASEFENEINACEENSYNLEKHRMNLNRTIKDRMIEIRSQKDLLNLKRKHLCEEKSTLRADIGERNKHIEAVRARFELTAKLLGSNEDGTLITSTQLKVATAQEKHMLLEEGNDLNEKVLVAEKEIEAMENTLMVFNHSNDNFRKSFKEFDNEDEALLEYKNLQATYCNSLACLKTLRNRLLHLEQDINKANNEREVQENILEMEATKRLGHNETLAKMQKELAEQQAKVQRADRELRNAMKMVKQRALSAEFLATYDHDLDLRELDFRNTKALNHLADIADNDNEIGPQIVRMLADKGLKMPHLLKKSQSFLSWRSDFSESSRSREITLTSRSSTSNSSAAQNILSPQVSVLSLNFPVN